MKSLTDIGLKDKLCNENIDFFITSASFESRCFEVSSVVIDFKFQKAIVFGTVDFESKIEINRKKIVKLLKQKTKKTISCDLLVNQPQTSFINIVKSCYDLFSGSPKTILVDITTFTHECLLMLTRVLISYKRDKDKLIMTYTAAKNYSYNIQNNDEKWLTKGVKKLRSIIGFPGYTDPSKRNHLIVLVGFEKERTIKLIEEFDFELVSLGIGSMDDSINHEFQKINQDKHKEILEIYSNANLFNISLTEPYKVKSQILEYIKKFKDYNIVIAPMNNKISTIGVGLAAIEESDIQLFYLQASIYNISAYSEASNEFFLFDIQ